MRGAISRTLTADSRRFAAFPFTFETGEDFVDDNGEVRGIASAIWLPLWDRPTTYSELGSFICDAQARLPGKEARFSAEFARALRSQGVDAGFAGWQEFRFRMRASRVPWVCTGRYLGEQPNLAALQLNDALAPLDESGFLDQFEVWRDPKDGKIKGSSPHYIRADLNAAIELAIAEPTPDKCIGVLQAIYGACEQLVHSKDLREKIGHRAAFFDTLPEEPWDELLSGLEGLSEFRIARALASIAGREKQRGRANGEQAYSKVQPFLGSLLPLKQGRSGWYLPDSPREDSKQAVWSGTDLCADLARVLARRYLDSLNDDLPALRSVRTAPLHDVIAFLNGELDDNRIARWTEGLSLIGWRWGDLQRAALEQMERTPVGQEQDDWLAIPPAYAALRSLLELECAWQGSDPSAWQKRRSHRPIALVSQRVPSSAALAVEDSLRWLSIWGVPNPWGEKARQEKQMLAGRDVIRLDHRQLDFGHPPRLVRRLAAAVAIPLKWKDRWKLFRAITLPQAT